MPAVKAKKVKSTPSKGRGARTQARSTLSDQVITFLAFMVTILSLTFAFVAFYQYG